MNVRMYVCVCFMIVIFDIHALFAVESGKWIAPVAYRCVGAIIRSEFP